MEEAASSLCLQVKYRQNDLHAAMTQKLYHHVLDHWLGWAWAVMSSTHDCVGRCSLDLTPSSAPEPPG